MDNIWLQSALWVALGLAAAMGALLDHDFNRTIRDRRRQRCGTAAEPPGSITLPALVQLC